MSEGPLGSRTEAAPLYRKIFTGFRIALDIKKLLLAAAGIFATFLGWWALSCVFYTADMPQWSSYERTQWTKFKNERRSWNLLHELAGSPAHSLVAARCGRYRHTPRPNSTGAGCGRRRAAKLIVDQCRGQLDRRRDRMSYAVQKVASGTRRRPTTSRRFPTTISFAKLSILDRDKDKIDRDRRRRAGDRRSRR